ncbi:O-antigen ligase family protein [Anaerosalibacter sp. Marseille-P3206]|uniref:O-antigen ligase family protein n=1 Tax=Anaerosalibacter sp. Marseille-P3206 TaxID=1871005 RepID=UPI0009875D08|nr:O-antigen ligase family protein [Anaerosalibacter sp. Marseille-P3206]
MTETLQKSLNKSILEDKKISIAIMSSFVILTIQYLILIYFNLIGTFNGNRIQILSKIIVGLFYIIVLPTVLKRNKFKFVIAYFISIFIFLLNYIFFRENWVYLKTIIFPFFFTSLPSLIYSYSINDWNVLKDVMKKTSLIVFIVGFIIGVLVFSNRASVGTYSMSLSYYMLLPTIVYMDKIIEKFNFKSLIVVLISLLIILAVGSRGAIMCIGVFIILKFITTKKKLNFKTILMYLIIIALIITFLLFLDTILENLYNFLLRFGIHSRSIQLFLQDDLHLSGRDYLYKRMVDETKANPLFGIGLAGDRAIMNGYVHNLILELIGNFGLIVGVLIITFLGVITFKVLFSKNKKVSGFMAIWFCIGVVHLMVSSSYLIDFKFWIFLGLSLRATFDKNHVIYKKNNVKFYKEQDYE